MTKKQVINDVIKSRRSVFPNMFSGDKIDDDIVKEMLENALWAPNHKKTEPWHFIVYTGKQMDALSEFCAASYKEVTPPEKFREMKYKKTRKKVLASSHVIAICLNRSIDVVIPEWEELAAAACAVQNFWLTVSAYGYGGYWSTPKYISIANEFIGLEDHQKCLGFFYLGVPQDGLLLKADRISLDQKVVWK